MDNILLFTDASVNPQSNVGYGAYLCLLEKDMTLSLNNLDLVKQKINIKVFNNTSSTTLELQTLLWALKEIQVTDKQVTIYTDCQNILNLKKRRNRLEKNNYQTKENKKIKHKDLYQSFFKITDQLNCRFVKVKGHQTSIKKQAIDIIFTLVDRASRSALRKHQL